MATPVQLIANAVRAVDATTSLPAFWPMMATAVPVCLLLGACELLYASCNKKRCCRPKALLGIEIVFFVGFLLVGTWGTSIAVLAVLSDIGDHYMMGITDAVISGPAFRWIISKVSLGFASRTFSLKNVIAKLEAAARERVAVGLNYLHEQYLQRRTRELSSDPNLQAIAAQNLNAQIRGSITRKSASDAQRCEWLARAIAEREPLRCRFWS